MHQVGHWHEIAVHLVAGSVCSSGQRSGTRQASEADSSSAKAQLVPERHAAEQLVYGARYQRHISGCVYDIHELHCSLTGFDVAFVAEHHEQQQYLHSCCTR
jgi:predicted nucleotidyltransferase